MNTPRVPRYLSSAAARVLRAASVTGVVLVLACGSNGKGSTGGGGNPITSQAGATGTDGGFACTTTADPGDMVSVAAGDFAMGCNEAVDKQCADDEKPQHTVTLSAFEIDRTEVTQAAYTACILDGACQPPSCDWNCDHPNFPAGCLTSTQAIGYCQWAQKRLPTEAEWEKAARGEQGNKYPWGNDEPNCTLANLAGCGDSLKDVGNAAAGASPYGALDMAGGVVEFVSDFYDEAYYADSPAADPKGPATGKRYSGRGGGFKSDADFVRSSKRDWYDTDDTAPSLGFRCAR